MQGLPQGRVQAHMLFNLFLRVVLNVASMHLRLDTSVIAVLVRVKAWGSRLWEKEGKAWGGKADVQKLWRMLTRMTRALSVGLH